MPLSRMRSTHPPRANQKAPDIERPIVEHEQAETEAAPDWTSEYQTAPECPLPWVDPGEYGNHLHMVEAIETLVRHEQPIHLAVADERLRTWWNVGRIGSKIRSNIDLAIQRAHVVRDGRCPGTVVLPGSDITQVRTPTGVRLATCSMSRLG